MKQFLHVGCGAAGKDKTTATFRQPDWTELRLDINPDAKPDVIGTMTDMDQIASGSMDAIFSSHNIEHLYPHEVPVALKEFLRVLGDDGFAVITCPDLQSVCELVAADKLGDVAYQSPAGPITPIDMLYGHRPQMAAGNLYMAHRCGFTRRVLAGSLRSAGFGGVVVIAIPQQFALWAVATKAAVSDAEIRALAEQHFPVKINWG